MSTALSIPQTSLSTYVAFDDANEQVVAFRENTAGIGFGLQDMVLVKTPSAESQFFPVTRAGNQEMLPKLTGLLVFQALQGILWPTSNDDKGGVKALPILITRDMRTATLNPGVAVERNAEGKITAIQHTPADMVNTLSALERPDGTWDWDKLPYSQFGSGRMGRGKFAKEAYHLFLLEEGSVVPIRFRSGPSAISNIQKFLRQLPVAYYRCRVELTLQKKASSGGENYNDVLIRMVSVISPEEGAIVRTKMRDVLAAEWNKGSIDATEEAD
jgi:hypothetical protein